LASGKVKKGARWCQPQLAPTGKFIPRPYQTSQEQIQKSVIDLVDTQLDVTEKPDKGTLDWQAWEVKGFYYSQGNPNPRQASE
jgi:hypothetical protein